MEYTLFQDFARQIPRPALLTGCPPSQAVHLNLDYEPLMYTTVVPFVLGYCIILSFCTVVFRNFLISGTFARNFLISGNFVWYKRMWKYTENFSEVLSIYSCPFWWLSLVCVKREKKRGTNKTTQMTLKIAPISKMFFLSESNVILPRLNESKALSLLTCMICIHIMRTFYNATLFYFFNIALLHTIFESDQ